MLLSKKVKLYIVHVIIPLILGVCIYVIFRNKNLRFFNWFKKISIYDYINTIRLITNPYKGFIPDWFYNSLPDGLWVYSFTSFYLIIWDREIEKMKYWLLLPLIFGCLVELAQKAKIFEGTYDPIDLLFGVLAFIISININKFKNETKIKVC
jgi:hypothetical protein